MIQHDVSFSLEQSVCKIILDLRYETNDNFCKVKRNINKGSFMNATNKSYFFGVTNKEIFSVQTTFLWYLLT